MILAIGSVVVMVTIFKLFIATKRMDNLSNAGVYNNHKVIYSEGMQGDRKGGIVRDKRISTSHIVSLVR